MLALRRFIAGSYQGKLMLSKLQTPVNIQKAFSHEGNRMPLDNLPFTIRSRYAATIKWCLFFGSGLWAPFLIVWYSMAKRTL